jgi:hypothetical protein
MCEIGGIWQMSRVYREYIVNTNPEVYFFDKNWIFKYHITRLEIV